MTAEQLENIEVWNRVLVCRLCQVPGNSANDTWTCLTGLAIRCAPLHQGSWQTRVVQTDVVSV